MSNVPNILKGAMKRSGMNEGHLAARCGVARSTMSNYLNNPKRMRLDTAAYLMAATNMDAKDRLEILDQLAKE